VARRGVARRGVARRGAAWRGVAWRGVESPSTDRQTDRQTTNSVLADRQTDRDSNRLTLTEPRRRGALQKPQTQTDTRVKCPPSIEGQSENLNQAAAYAFQFKSGCCAQG
jgi:hypothetical protein